VIESPAIPARPLLTQRPATFVPAGIASLTPNWFASVMGTGILANAAVTLPAQERGQRIFAAGAWLLAVGLLIALTVLTTGHWTRHRSVARQHHRHPVMAHFYGAPPMALMTVGAGTLLVGRDLVGLHAALVIDWTLWAAGTALGLVTTFGVPLLMARQHTLDRDDAFGGWLMPVVPPMVSAATGALLLPHVPAGPARVGLLMACYAMFALSLAASLVVIPMIAVRQARHSIGPAAMVPTLFIVLGPLGQSVTAANLLGGNAHLVVGAHSAAVLRDVGIAYGLPVIGLALAWAGFAATVTVRTALHHLPFALTWWSFTFPIGTCVTGLTALSVRTGSVPLRDTADAAYVVLLGAWVMVAVRTLTSQRGAVRRLR
jgi:tellurite resistance protein TehA-like permease